VHGLVALVLLAATTFGDGAKDAAGREETGTTRGADDAAPYTATCTPALRSRGNATNLRLDAGDTG
jgi:hypothetical protein